MHTRIAGGCLYHASVALGKPIKTRSRFKIVTFCCVEYTGSAKGISLLSDERYCMTITLCFCDNSIYHKICVLTCGRIIFAPTDLYKKKRQHNFCTVLVGADDGARTRYLHLGKVALYQMSYIRILLVPPGGIEPPTRGFSVPCSTY